MHGLRCEPGLLGWTRLLDEWVVGLASVEVGTGSLWDDRSSTIATLADAITRVRTFAGRSDDIAPTTADAQGGLQFELQGVCYRVSTTQCFPATPEAFRDEAGRWLANPTTPPMDHGGTAARVMFVTPRLGAADQARPFEVGSAFVSIGATLELAACAFSFPDEDERVRYHYANDHYPGVLLLVDSGAF